MSLIESNSNEKLDMIGKLFNIVNNNAIEISIKIEIIKPNKNMIIYAIIQYCIKIII